MSGVELAKAVHAVRFTLPVIFVTGDLDLLKEFDESRVLQKPFNERELADNINAALVQLEL
jgi:FixJ family two-component response regulator